MTTVRLNFPALLASAIFIQLHAFAQKEQVQAHWAFQPIAAPNPPPVRNSAWVANSIDAFILARLEAAGLEPSPQAQPETLLRRLHLDLTGLLPSTAELDAFLADWRSDADAAYAAKLDELLASPHFAERWARHWLDLARYGDSDGYLGDNLRPWAWVYRDWVIDAIHRDQPFDQFSIDQLAGDLLPESSQNQKIATGFHRNNLKNTEAGSDAELNRTKQIVDRVATTGTAWLGLTVACAECHDHKHDPISQREFYRLYAFFNNTNDADISVRLPAEWAAYEAKKHAWEAKLGTLLGPLQGLKPNPRPLPSTNVSWSVLHPDKTTAASTDLAIQDDGSVLASSKKTPATVSYFVETPVAEARTVTGFRLEVFGEFGIGRERGKTNGRGENGEFVVSIFIADLLEKGQKPRRLPLLAANADHHDALGVEKALDYANTEGWRVATRTFEPHVAVFQLAKPERLPAGSRVKFSIGQKHGSRNSMRHFRLSATSEAGPFEVRAAPASSANFAKLRQPVEEHLANQPAKPSTKAQTLTEREKSDRRRSFVHVRGDYEREGEAVSPGTPAILHPSRGQTRLDLANWLFDPKNPLTARVAANQIWQPLFGEGIVRTPDDFGTHGAMPTHPRLLDWLATEFRRTGWSRKALIRTIVLSSAYRQSSANTRPERSNALLWRQNSFRVSAETVRDVHLTASGLLERKIGGPGIRPPLPEFVTEVGRSVKWPVSQGRERYRRGLYIFLKRTVLYPMLTAFDAPDTTVACSRRERTNTPMQALTLLNDPVFYECAEALAREILDAHGDDVRAGIRDLWRCCLAREPSPEELAALLAAYRDFRRETDKTLAAIATARIVMNLDEFVTRD